MSNSLRHIVLIPDGNRRWARERDMLPMEGHEAGAKNSETIIEEAFELGFECVTIWGASVSNLTNRSKAETTFLKKAFARYFRELIERQKIHENRVRVRVLGRWRELFTKEASDAMEAAIDATKEYDGRNLTFLLGYSGTDEMINAVNTLIKEGREVDSVALKNALWTKDLPPVDLVVRTGGEPHWSQGFMMWDVAEARLHFTETLWPALTEEELREIVESYKKTERRFGK